VRESPGNNTIGLTSPKVKKLLEGRLILFCHPYRELSPWMTCFKWPLLAPRLLGAMGKGPQTYLIMIQNEDELRPTGGFLSAVGLSVLKWQAE
jgi:hypothetical protein